jgi:hypothetical protein
VDEWRFGQSSQAPYQVLSINQNIEKSQLKIKLAGHARRCSHHAVSKPTEVCDRRWRRDARDGHGELKCTN